MSEATVAINLIITRKWYQFVSMRLVHLCFSNRMCHISPSVAVFTPIVRAMILMYITTVGVAYIWSSATLFIFSPKLSSHGSFKWTFKVKDVKAAAGWMRRNTYSICDNEFCFLYTKGGAHCKSRKLKLYSNVKNHISFAEVMEKQTRKWMECQFSLSQQAILYLYMK